MLRITLLKSISLFIVLVLIHAIIFPQTDFDSRNFYSRNFDSRILDNRFDRADREITPYKWMEQARRGIESARILWEESIPLFYRDQLLFDSLSKEFNEWTEEELEKRFNQWLLNRFFGEAAQSLTLEIIKEREKADRLFLYKTDEDGNILFDDNTGDPLIIRLADEAYNYENDLFSWRRQIKDSVQNETEKYEQYLLNMFPELLVYIDDSRREDFAKKLTETANTAVQSLQNEFAALLSREERLFTARRLGDVYSLRKKSEDNSVSSISTNLIEQTRRITDEGIAILEAKIEAAYAGTDDLSLAGAEWLSLYREQFERGLGAWEQAEERFFTRRAQWEYEAVSYYLQAETEWNDVFIQFNEARLEWEYRAKKLFESGESLFKNASAVLEKTILEAKAEFAKDSRLRTESAVDKARAWADMYITASAVVIEAVNNLEFWNDRLKRESNLNSQNQKTILSEIEKWTALYNLYYEKAQEAKNYLQNEFNMAMGNGILGISGEDIFQDEYHAELIRAQAVAGYWSKRVAIAQAVFGYAQDFSAGRITESEGIIAWENAKDAYDDALLYYQECVNTIKNLGMESEQILQKMTEASAKLQKSEMALEELNHTYSGLLLAFGIQKENYFLDEIAKNNTELTKIAAILDDTGHDSIVSRFVMQVYENGQIQQSVYKADILKELVVGGLYFEKSLAELSRIAVNIKTFGPNDILPGFADEFGIIHDSIFFPALEEMLWEKDYYLSRTSNENEFADICEKYNSMISALCASAKKTAIREEQNRILAINMLFSTDVELIDNTRLYNEWENACQELFLAQVELELQALRYLLNGQPSDNPAILLSNFCFLGEQDLVNAEYALESILSILLANHDKGADYINYVIQNAADKNEFIGYFMVLGSFFLSSSGYSYTDFFLDPYIEKIESVEGLSIAYDFAGITNQAIIQSVRNEKIQSLHNKYDEIGVKVTGLLPDGINDLINALILQSDNPFYSAAEFLVLLDDVIDLFPEWIYQEIITWKETFIDMLSGKVVQNNEINESQLIFMQRKTELINSLYTMCINAVDPFAQYFIEAADKYIEQPLSHWEEIMLDTGIFPGQDRFEMLFNELSFYLSQEQYLYEEIQSLKKNLGLLVKNDGSLESEIQRVFEEIELMKNNADILADEYGQIAEDFRTIAAGYDAVYLQSKTAYLLMEDCRFEYEIQDAIRRWASTAYLDAQEPLLDLQESREKLGKAQSVVAVLEEINSGILQRQDGNNVYNLLYEKYNESYAELYIALTASEKLDKELSREAALNIVYYEAYCNQLIQWGGSFLNYFDNPGNEALQALLKILKLENGKLSFSRDNSFNLITVTDRQFHNMKEYFSNNLFSEYETRQISEFENQLLNLSQRLRSYNFSFDKYLQWGLASEYFLFQISQNLDVNTKNLLHLNNIPQESESNRDAWNGLSGQERTDLEFLIILNLTKQNNALFLHISEFIETQEELEEAEDILNNKRFWKSIPLLGLFFINSAREAAYNYETIKNKYDFLERRVYGSYSSLTRNMNLLNGKYNDYIKSCQRLSLLKSDVSDTGKLSWSVVTKALSSLGLPDSDIREMELFWNELTSSYDITGMNLQETFDLIVNIKKTELDKSQTDFENFWQENHKEYLDNYDDYLKQYELFLSGNISTNVLKLSAEKTFGNNTVFAKDHLNNIDELIVNNLSLFSIDNEGLRLIQETLLEDYVRLINRAYISRYDTELKTRQAEWELQRKDIDEKYQAWVTDALQIMERGREDWKDNSIKMEDASNLWFRAFEDEYRRTSDAWAAAYLEGLKDKEEWVERASRAAEQASSQALLMLIGSDGEAMARAMDTRNPVYFQGSDSINDARKTLGILLSAAGINKLEQIFGSVNGIAATINTTIKSGLGMGNISNYGNVQSEALRMAKTAKEDVSARESARIAMNVRDTADMVISSLTKSVEKANTNMRIQMDDIFLLQGSWRRSGLDYQKDVLVHSTFFNSIITENVLIEGYRNYIFDPVRVTTDLSEDKIKYLDSASINFLIESLIHEISEITSRIFDPGYADDGSSTGGEFLVHIGSPPKEREKPTPGDDKSELFEHQGNGELGRLLTNYYYWYFRELNGLALLNAAPWDRPIWDSRGSFFNAPSLRGVVSLGVQVFAAVTTGGIASPLVSSLAGTAADLVFGFADVAGGYKSFAEAGVDFGKSIVMNVVSSTANTLTGGLTQNLANIAGRGAAAQFGANIGSVMLTGAKDLTVGTINSAISAVSYSDSNGWGWSQESFNAGVKNTFRSTLATATGTFTTSSLNITLEGFTGSYHSDGNKLHSLVGGLAGQGVNYALGGDISLNLFNIGIFSNESRQFSMGLLELNIGRNGIEMDLGSGGVDASAKTLAGAVKGFETWKVNAEILASGTQASKLYKSQIRTLYSGNETLRQEYENVLAGRTIYEESDNYYTQSKYDEYTGVKTIYLGTDAMGDGSRFGLNVVFAHEAYRNGIVENDATAQSAKTKNAVYGHSQTALDLKNTYGIGSLGAWMALEALAYDNCLKTGNSDFMDSIADNLYDSSGEFWKLVKDENGFWSNEWDGSYDFDINELLLSAEFLKGDGSIRSAIAQVLVDSHTYDMRNYGTISAKRMDPSVVGMLGNAVVSAPMTATVFQNSSIGAHSNAVRNALIADTMEKMSINASNMSGVYNEYRPYILGLGENGYEYLVPILNVAGSVSYYITNEEQFQTHYNQKMYVESMRQQGEINYKYGKKDFIADGGVDCSGFVSWAIMETTGLRIPTNYLNADALANHPYLAKGAGDNSAGTLNFYYNEGKPFHHVTTDTGNNQEINPYGSETLTPSFIRVMDYVPSSGIRDNRQVNWHFLFFIYDGNAGNFSREDTFRLRNYF